MKVLRRAIFVLCSILTLGLIVLQIRAMGAGDAIYLQQSRWHPGYKTEIWFAIPRISFASAGSGFEVAWSSFDRLMFQTNQTMPVCESEWAYSRMHQAVFPFRDRRNLKINLLGIRYRSYGFGDPASAAFFHRRHIEVPIWLLILLTVSPVAWQFIKWQKRRHLDPTAVPCPKCGYDLRMTPERCPECGWTK